jgi:hypothetical protein
LRCAPGTQKSNISRFESGNYNPSLDFITQIVAAGQGVNDLDSIAVCARLFFFVSMVFTFIHIFGRKLDKVFAIVEA